MQCGSIKVDTVRYHTVRQNGSDNFVTSQQLRTLLVSMKQITVTLIIPQWQHFSSHQWHVKTTNGVELKFVPSSVTPRGIASFLD